MSYIAYFDGACEPKNPGGTASLGAVIYKGEEKVWECSKIHDNWSVHYSRQIAIEERVRCPSMDMRRVVALNVRRLRERAGLSQEELAARAGLARTYISGIENGRRNPTVIVLHDIAMQLGADPRDLLDPRVLKV